MNTTQLRIIGTGLFFLFIFLSGYWLSRSGKPYSTIIFNIHKLIGLAAGIFLIMTIYRVHQMISFDPIQIAALVVTVIIFVSLVAAGGLLSIEAADGLGNVSPSMKSTISVIHKVFPYLAVLSMAATLYLLLFRKA